MSLNPADIEAHVFPQAFRGYDQDAVDEFLDRVADRINELLADRERLEDRLRRVETEAAESVEAERLLKRTLITAQRTADQTVAEAQQEAERLRTDAERYAAELREETERRAAAALEDAARTAAATIDDAERRASATIVDAQERAESIVTAAQRDADADRRRAAEAVQRVSAAVADLQRFRSDYRERVRGVIAEHLAALERVGEVPPIPDELASVPQRVRGAAGTPEEGFGTMRPQTDDAVETRAGGAGGPTQRDMPLGADRGGLGRSDLASESDDEFHGQMPASELATGHGPRTARRIRDEEQG